MGIFKLLPLMCLAAAAFAIRVPLCRPRFGQGDGSAESNEICLCSTGSPTIINRIDIEHVGVERLVIFVYRKPNTGEIISFIPEGEYQRRIPDFPEDYGITEEISYNLSILDIFDNSPNKDIRRIINTDKPAPFPQANQVDVVDVTPKDLDIVNGHPEKDTIPHWQTPVTKPSEDIEFPWQGPVTQPSEVQDIELPYQRPVIEPSDVEPAEIHPHTEPGTNEYETNVPTDNNEHFVYIPKVPPIYVTPGHDNRETNPFENNPDSETSGGDEPNRDREPSSQIHTRPINSAENPQVPDDSVEDDRGGNLPSNIVAPAKRFTVPLKNKYGSIIGWTHASKTYWGKGRNTPSHIQYDPSSHYDDGHTLYFDYWLMQQLKFTSLSGNRIPTSTNDIVALHTAIRNVLLQNGFVVTRHGALTDGYGKVTSLDNLKLRPIFIGKSFSYDRFMQGGGAKFKIPTDLPFLEGLLLTMIKPAKILGIVPLKITSLSDELSPDHKHKKLIYGHGLHPGQKASFKVLPIEDLVAFRKRSKGSKNRHPRPHSSKITKNKYKDSVLLQQALSEMSKPGHARDKGLGELEKGVVSEEKPDFRIIGGASATSSGTPLLFKGRSGLI